RLRIRLAADARQDLAIDRDVALAAARRDDHVGPVEQRRVALQARRGERQPGRVDADALPGLHLPLVALLRYLQLEVHGTQPMHDERREALGIMARRARDEPTPRGLHPLSEGGEQSDPGDDDLPAFSHGGTPRAGTRALGPCLAWSDESRTGRG